MSSRPVNLCEGPFAGKIIRYSVPIVLGGILQLAFNAADLIIVGQYCGSSSMGAVGSTSSLTTLLVNFFMGLSVGSGVAVAQAIGAGNGARIRDTVHTAMPTAILCGLILTVVGIGFSDDLLIMMGTPEEELPLATLYMRIYFGGITASMVYNFGASILRAAGDTKNPLYFLIASGILNVSLNTVFVTVFHMDVAGVALATVLSLCLSAILVVLALKRRTDDCKLSLRKMRIKKDPLKKILAIGVPSGIQSSLFAISNVMIQSTVNSFGSVVLRGNSAANSIGGFVYTAMNSIYQSATNFVGQNMGARRFDNIKKISCHCLVIVGIIGIVTGALATIFGEPLLSIYITDSPESIPYGMMRLQIMVLPYFLCGLMDVTTGMLRGMGSSTTPMIISVMGACGFRIFWILWILPFWHTPAFLYVSYPISWILTFLAQIIAFVIIFRRKKKLYATRASEI